MEVVGQALLSATLEPLIGKLTSGELLSFIREQQVESEVKKWESKLFQIHAVLNDAEEKQMTDTSVKLWLSNLRDLAYDVEDILDKFATEASLSKLNAESHSSSCAFRKLIPTSLKSNARNIEMDSKLRDITERLQEIVTQKDGLLLLRTDGRFRSSSNVKEKEPTSSVVKERFVYGREKEKEDIVDWLMSGEVSNSSFSVISIVGMGGVGKTTLAQCVYNDERVKFDCKAWACVSDDFNIPTITKAILSHWCKVDDSMKMQEMLQRQLSGKKFLIILDDVWNENYEKWTTLCGPFISGAPGSKIIVTTRSKDVSKMVGSVCNCELKELSNEECLSLFCHHALDAENFDQHIDLKEMGKEIVNRCKGLPLAAKTLGGLLRGKRGSDEWKDILNSKIWELDQTKSGILPALMLSYYHLPSHLKQCFTYCAIFPKDYEFDKNELVLLWKAEGFLQQIKKQQSMEDLGRKYFDDLLSRSFFQQSNSDNQRYVMHDLVSDLAQYISRQTCFNLGEENSEANAVDAARIRYSSFTRQQYDVTKRFDVFHRMRSMRTFLALPICLQWGVAYAHLSSQVLRHVITEMKALRVLSLAGYKIMHLPSSVGGLKHLRYLNLSGSRMARLPESMCELYNLQTLMLAYCSELIKLPTGISMLINLHHLDISHTWELKEMPKRMGNLTNLQTLSKFIVGKGNGVKVKELMKLSQLEGELQIEQLQNVTNIREAELANLKEKKGLTKLVLEWTKNFNYLQNESKDEQVLKALQPHEKIEKFSIGYYGGTTFPSWLGHVSFSNMTSMALYNCSKVTMLPPFGQLPLLEELSIIGLHAIKEVGLELCGEGLSSSKETFSSLKTLTIDNMQNWERWYWSARLGEEVTIADVFPKLCLLALRQCPKLVGKLPSCLLSLKELDISECPQLEELPKMLPSLCKMRLEECKEMVLRDIPHLPSLVTLHIRSISGLKSLHQELIHSLEVVEELEIRNCKELSCLWRDGMNIDKLGCLKTLWIEYCGELVSLVDGAEGIMPRNLEKLGVENCDKLKKLPSGWHSLPCLKSLSLYQCEQLGSLTKGEGGTFPCNLETLGISSCPNLTPFPTSSLPCNIRDVDICCYGSQECSPSGEEWLPRSLETLTIRSFPVRLLGSLNSGTLPHLTTLHMVRCYTLECFPEGGLLIPTLMNLSVCGCKKLRSLPNQMQHLTSLRCLSILDCGQLESFPEGGLPPNLTTLEIYYCENLKQPMSDWGLHNLVSLTRLHLSGEIGSIHMVVSFPDEKDGLCILPTSLTYLQIERFKNLKSISRTILNLTSLEHLGIYRCPKLRSLPKQGLPPTLGSVEFTGCPRLTIKLCFKRYHSIIAHIPCIFIEQSYRLYDGKMYRRE